MRKEDRSKVIGERERAKACVKAIEERDMIGVGGF